MSQPDPRRRLNSREQHNQHLPHADPRGAPVGDQYDAMVPGQGYTAPYQAPPPQPEPKGLARWTQQYQNLRQRARANSMSWWLMKALQGILLGGPLVALGTSLLVINAVSWHEGIGVLLLSLFLILVGLRYIIYYGLAPWLQPWIVTVPDKQYQLVVQRGNAIEYLPAGPLHVPFRLNAQIVEYVNFQSVHAKDVYHDVLRGYGPLITLEVGIMMAFNPVDADSRYFEQLRSMNRPDHFQRVIADTTYEALTLYLEQFDGRHWHRAIMDRPELTRYLTESMWSLAGLGLTPAGGQPVTLFVHDQSAPHTQPAQPAEPTQAHLYEPPADAQPTVARPDYMSRAPNRIDPAPSQPEKQRRRARRLPIGAEADEPTLESAPNPEKVLPFTSEPPGTETVPPFSDGIEDLELYIDPVLAAVDTENPTVLDEFSQPSAQEQRVSGELPKTDAPVKKEPAAGSKRTTPHVREVPTDAWIRPTTQRRQSESRRSKPKLPVIRPPDLKDPAVQRTAHEPVDPSPEEAEQNPPNPQPHTPPFGASYTSDDADSKADDN